MAPERKSTAFRSKVTEAVTSSSAGAFVSLKLRPELLLPFGESDVQIDHHIQRHRNLKLAKSLGIGIVPGDAPLELPLQPPEMHTRGAWSANLANPARASPSPVADVAPSGVPAGKRQRSNKETPNKKAPSSKAKAAKLRVPPQPQVPTEEDEPGETSEPPRKKRKSVHFAIPADDGEDDVEATSEVTSSPPSADAAQTRTEPSSDTDKENNNEEGEEDEDEKEDMEKPKLKLRMSSISGGATPGVPQTPGIKLKISQTPTAATPSIAPGSPAPSEPTSKKRKKHSVSIAEQPVTHASPAPTLRKITFKNQKKAAEAAAQTPITPLTPAIKIKTKGKIPKRPMAVGYDSELDDREVDPVILEGFILRMQPGPDCEAVRKAIEDGTLGVYQGQGGTRVNIRFFDTQGRRGILGVRDTKYAVTMVDLPCIIEGMKSWDKKGFIKSLDVSQMLLVLGPCKNDEEARTYAFPPDVNPHNHQYAHGITAPMKWVRKRRFARTKKIRLDDIEAIDRRVSAMLEADRLSREPVKVELTDRDPRRDQEQYSGEEEEEDEEDEDMEDADGEIDDEPDDYFNARNAGSGQVVETPGFAETPAEDIDEDDINEFERMFAEQDAAAAAATAQKGALSQTRLAPEAADSSFAVTSTSASPSADTGTPAMNADTPASGAATTDDDDVSDEDEEEKDEDEKDDDENVVQVKERIQDLQERIEEQMATLVKTGNMILRKKIAKKISDLKGDVGVLRRSIGLSVQEEGEEGEGEA